MEIAIFDRPNMKKKKVGIFYIEDGVVKFKHKDDSPPVSDEDFNFLWGNSYLSRVTNKLISKSNPEEYLKGLLDRFVGGVWAEEVG